MAIYARFCKKYLDSAFFRTRFCKNYIRFCDYFVIASPCDSKAKQSILGDFWIEINGGFYGESKCKLFIDFLLGY
ncbi:hypothetical protein [Helicobacter sp. 23-1045]